MKTSCDIACLINIPVMLGRMSLTFNFVKFDILQFANKKKHVCNIIFRKVQLNIEIIEISISK